MATDHWWLGTTDTDPTVAANWSTAGSGGVPGVSTPGTGDEVEFDGNGNNPCTFVGNMAFLNLVLVAGYTAKLDLATFNLTMDDGGNVILDGGGEFDCGTGDHSITNGTLDNKDQATWTRGSSTWTLNGVCTIIGHSSKIFNNLIFAPSSIITIDASTNARVVSQGTCTINGAVVLDDILAVTADGDFVLNEGASFSGSSYIYCRNSNSEHGLTTLHSSVSTGQVWVFGSVAGTRLAAGTYGDLVKLRALGSIDMLLELDNDTYNFDGGLELENGSTGAVTLQNKTNVPIINVTDLTIDRNSGTIVIDDSGQAVDWTITGDVIDEAATGFTWIKGLGDITLSGSADQDIDFMGQTVGDIIINKSAGALTFSGAFTTDSFTGTSTGTGDLDPNGQTITIIGNCSWAAAFDFNAGATTMNGCTWIVGGNFTANGQALAATAVWYLQVSGTAVASGTGAVAYSDASGTTTEVDAFSGPWTDGGNNINWKFGALVVSVGLGNFGDFNDQEIYIGPDRVAKILV